MNITHWHTYRKPKELSYRGRDIFLKDNLLIGTWYCLDMLARELRWSINDQKYEADTIIGVYENIIVAERQLAIGPSMGGVGFYRFDLQTGELLWDEIKARPPRWFIEIFKPYTDSNVREFRSHYTLMDAGRVLDICTGRFTAMTEREFLQLPVKSQEVPSNEHICIDDKPMDSFPQEKTLDNPVVRWARKDNSSQAEIRVEGVFPSVFHHKTTSGNSVLILRKEYESGEACLVFYDDDRVVIRPVITNANIDRIDMNDNFLVITADDKKEKTFNNLIFRIEN